MVSLNSKQEIREHLIDLTKELVLFPSHSKEPLKIFELAEFIKHYFDQNDGLYVNEHVIEGKPSLVITTQKTKHPHLMLSGHIDVVISSPQFVATEKGGKLYGSGAMDMKGGVACMMAIMKYFAGKEKLPSLGLIITSDEESGGHVTRELLNEYSTDFCIVNEGRYKYDIVTREKGIFIVKVSLEGPCIHSAYPWKGRNALEALAELSVNLKSHFPEEKDGWYPTMSVTEMSGSGGINTIPGNAEAIFSFRLTDDEEFSRIKILEKIKIFLPNVEIEEMVYGNVFTTDPTYPLMQLLKKSADKVLDTNIEFGQNNGASDARFFMSHDIPTAILGPVGFNPHSTQEYVEISSLVTHFEVLKTFIIDECKLMDDNIKSLES